MLLEHSHYKIGSVKKTSGLCSDVRVDAGEVEFACDHEDDHANGTEPAVSASLALGRPEEPIDGLEEPVGVARGDPGEDAVEMSADHLGDFPYRLDFRAQHVAAPAVEQQGCTVWLLAGEDLAQLFTGLPGACGAGRGHLGEQPIELRARRDGERGAILQQHPALAVEARVELLFDAAHLVDRFRGPGDDVERVEGDLGMGQMLADPADEGRGHVDSDRLDLGRPAVMSAQVRLERLGGGGVLALGHEDPPSAGRIRIGIGEERHVLAALGPGGLIERHPPHLAEVGRAHRLIHVLLAQRHDPLDRQSTDAPGAREGRLPCQQQHERLKQQREPGELAAPGRGDLNDLAVRQLHPRNLHLELALVLEEVQVPARLGDGVVHRRHTCLPRHGKAAADLEIHPNAELALLRLKVHPGDEPGAADAEGRLEDLLNDHCDLSVCGEPKSYRSTGPIVPPGPVALTGPRALAALARALGRAACRRPAVARLRHCGLRGQPCHFGPHYPLGIRWSHKILAEMFIGLASNCRRRRILFGAARAELLGCRTKLFGVSR